MSQRGLVGQRHRHLVLDERTASAMPVAATSLM
jgi:hypothetical protein